MRRKATRVGRDGGVTCAVAGKQCVIAVFFFFFNNGACYPLNDKIRVDYSNMWIALNHSVTYKKNSE